VIYGYFYSVALVKLGSPQCRGRLVGLHADGRAGCRSIVCHDFNALRAAAARGARTDGRTDRQTDRRVGRQAGLRGDGSTQTLTRRASDVVRRIDAESATFAGRRRSRRRRRRRRRIEKASETHLFLLRRI